MNASNPEVLLLPEFLEVPDKAIPENAPTKETIQHYRAFEFWLKNNQDVTATARYSGVSRQAIRRWRIAFGWDARLTFQQSASPNLTEEMKTMTIQTVIALMKITHLAAIRKLKRLEADETEFLDEFKSSSIYRNFIEVQRAGMDFIAGFQGKAPEPKSAGAKVIAFGPVNISHE